MTGGDVGVKMSHPRPPLGWPQKPGRRSPFAPGDGDDGWEIIVDREPGGAWTRYHVRSTGQVYRDDGGIFTEPTWWELPPSVRRAVWQLNLDDPTPAA